MDVLILSLSVFNCQFQAPMSDTTCKVLIKEGMFHLSVLYPLQYDTYSLVSLLFLLMNDSRSDRFNYHQIKFMVDTLEAKGETPLVIIPNKYAHDEFVLSRGENQRLDRAEIEIMDDLIKSGKLYKGEFGSLVLIRLVGTHSHESVHFAYKQSLHGVSMTFIGCSLAYQTKPYLAMDRIYLFQTMTLMDDFRGVVQC